VNPRARATGQDAGRDGVEAGREPAQSRLPLPGLREACAGLSILGGEAKKRCSVNAAQGQRVYIFAVGHSIIETRNMKHGYVAISALLSALAACGSPGIAGGLEAAPAPYDWTGFYAGAQAQADWVNAQEVSPFNLPAATVSGAGLNLQSLWQRNSLVFGVEADADALAGANTGACEVGGPDYLCSYGATWDASVRAKLGFAAGGLMAFGTGGWGWSDNNLSVSHSGVTERDFKTLDGWLAGGGLSFAINDRWFATVEYLHYDLGSAIVRHQVAFGTSDVRPVSDTVTLGFDYRF